MVKPYNEYLASAIAQCMVTRRSATEIADILIEEGYVVDPVDVNTQLAKIRESARLIENYYGGPGINSLNDALKRGLDQ